MLFDIMLDISYDQSRQKIEALKLGWLSDKAMVRISA